MFTEQELSQLYASVQFHRKSIAKLEPYLSELGKKGWMQQMEKLQKLSELLISKSRLNSPEN